MPGDPTGLSAIVRLLARHKASGFQVFPLEKPPCVGIRRGTPPNDKWSWFYGATPALALAQAEAGLKERKLALEET